MGRSKKEIDPRDYPKLQTMSGFGIPLEQIAAVLEISPSTLKRRIAESEELSDLVEKGRGTVNTTVVTSLYESAVKRHNVAAQIFWCKTRMGWREVQRIEHTGAGGGSVAVRYQNMTEDEVDRRAKAAMDELRELVKEGAS